jgi:tetratricopeptide (TPR) repeat protein
MESARSVFKDAIKVCQRDENAWINLGHLYRIERRISNAIIAYQKAFMLDPQNSLANSSLMACYRLSGKDDLAEEQRKLAQSIVENETEYHRAVFESVCGNTSKAIDLLAIALEKKQIGVNWIRRDPNLDFIRDDPRFEQLSYLGDLNSREK